jgi:hypothetical protein
MDIVEQLRKCANTVYSQDGYTFRLGLQNEAADEIERLREALRFYASFADALPHENITPLMVDRGNKARAALKEGE